MNIRPESHPRFFSNALRIDRVSPSAAAFFFALAWIGAANSAYAKDNPLEGFDDYAAAAVADWKTPGLAIAIVKDDAIVFAKGYGVREIGKKGAIDEHSLFAVGSTSKAFTVASLGMLVEAGKIEWDDHVTEHLRGFQLFDPYVTRELTVTDLLCHRSGLARGDQLWYASPFNREEVLRRVRYLEPTWSFRSHYGYQNIMFLAAGQIVPAVTGKSWDEFVRERIFEPLGMRRSNTSVTELKKGDNVAQPHLMVEGKIQVIPYRNLDNVAPAGSINSSVYEMAQWIRLQLGEGTYEGKQLLKAESIRRMHSSHMVIPITENGLKLLPSNYLQAYGLGWSLGSYRGKKTVSHGGGIDGMNTMVHLMPEEEMGVVAITNMLAYPVLSALAYRVYDSYLGGEMRDWNAILHEDWDKDLKKEEEARQKVIDARVKDTEPSLAIEEYAGVFEDRLYGETRVDFKDGQLTISRGPNITGTLNHWHYDTFQAVFDDPTMGKGLMTFNLGPGGKVKSLEVKGLTTFELKADDEEPES